jgi:hypothetical protein
MKRFDRPFGLGALLILGLALASAPACQSDDGEDGASSTGGISTGGSEASGGTMTAETGGVGGGSTGGAGGEDGTGGAPLTLALPEILSETGLYEADMETLAEGVRPFRPQFPLWTDGAKKSRWILLPEGEQIDTSDMDYWELPIGTKLWKEFERDGVRVETRLLQRQFNGVWMMVAYQWRGDLSDADAVPEGVENASGTEHDIPREDQCWQCHNQMPGRTIGFTAVQLAHDAGMGVGGAPAVGEWTLDDLVADGLLTDNPAAIVVPGDDTERTALGYLHANCGHCHHPQSSVSGRVDMNMWLSVGSLGSVAETPTYMTTVGVNAALPEEGPPNADIRIAPQDLASSNVYQRFNTLGENYSMPPLGTEIVDPAGEEALRLWIESLNP